MSSNLISLLFSGASTALATAGALQSAGFAEDSGSFNASVSISNADAQRAEAAYIRKRVELDVASLRRETSVLKGSQRAAYAASGVVVDEGSAMDALKDTAAQAQLDINLIRMEGEMDAYRAEAKADQYEAEAEIERWKGRQTSTGYKLKAGASLLEGATDLWSKWNS